MLKPALIVFFVFVSAPLLWAQEQAPADELQPYIEVLEKQGREPVDYVVEQLRKYDLLIFDDALHTALEPFDFYQELIRTPAVHQLVKLVFLEVIPLNKQHHLDAYFDAEEEDRNLLLPAFQDDINGLGWRYRTYFDLLRVIHQTNRDLPKAERIRVIAVDNPTYWPEIYSVEDVEQFRKSLLGRDHSMYAFVLNELDRFKSGRKGIFLTNTRHAYKGIKRKSGQFYWNTGTFFHQWHPGKTFSIRIHNVTLQITKQRSVNATESKTTQGLEQVVYQWVRMQGGLWDSAFEAKENRPIAISLKDNVFGSAPYVGNHMLGSAAGQTMYDAYDGLIFLAPLEELRQSAQVDSIFTSYFRSELQRRFRLLFTSSQIEQQLRETGAHSLSELIDMRSNEVPEQLLPQAQGLEPIDAWRSD